MSVSTVDGELNVSIKALPCTPSIFPRSLLPGVKNDCDNNDDDDALADFSKSRSMPDDLSVVGSLRSEAHRLASASSWKMIVLAFFFFTLVNGFFFRIDFDRGSCCCSRRNGKGVLDDSWLPNARRLDGVRCIVDGSVKGKQDETGWALGVVTQLN